jgi:transcriptional repressor NrdR
MRYLRRLDPIAFVRFASVYREFRDVRQLVDEAQDVMRRAKDEDPTQQDLFS